MSNMWIGLAVLLAFSVWAYVSYDFSAVASSFAVADWRLLLGVMLFYVFLLYFRVFKWRFFFGSYRKVSFYNMSLAAFAAYTCNMVMPARVGGLVQAWLLGHKESMSKSTALGTVALIRVMDGITIAAVGLLVFSFMDVPPDKGLYWESFKKSGLLFTSFFLFITATLFIFRKSRTFLESFQRIAKLISPRRFQSKVEEIVELFWEGFGVLNQTRYLLLIVFLSFTFWCLAATSIFLVLTAFGIEDIKLITPFFVLLAQVIGFMIPSPGYVGPYHAATVISLSFYGITGERALSIAIIMHAAMFITNTLPGLVYLWFENINIFTMAKKAEVALMNVNEKPSVMK